ncbi:hypothetical protein [Kiloniella sp. EL199]|uniref:hypothetical protein n=1 Tax=Kiloniella sp. EL199 TaxID=2107581 RepID=UPI000EA0EB81|nr:hypothetical protein [Kiloniella sp. EL199]
MFKELKRIYKTLKAGKKFGNKGDAEPFDVPASPLSLPEKTNQSETPKHQDNNQHRNTHSPSTIQQNNAPLAANHFSRAAKEKNEKPTPFFKRLYNALYLEALFLALVQMNAANAEDKQQTSVPGALALADDTHTPDEALLSSANTDWSRETGTLKSLTLRIDDFVDSQNHLGTSTEFQPKDIRLDHLLEDVATYSNFSPIKLKELDKSKTVSLQEFNKENEFDIIEEDNYILIELDDDALLFATEELAVFGGDGFNFFIVNNETLNLFENNTLNNSWGSLRPGQEYFVLKKEDVLEEDIEIVTVEEEISFDDDSKATEIISVNYFMYQETIIGMSFDLPHDFYQKHGDIDLADFFT